MVIRGLGAIVRTISMAGAGAVVEKVVEVEVRSAILMSLAVEYCWIVWWLGASG